MRPHYKDQHSNKMKNYLNLNTQYEVVVPKKGLELRTPPFFRHLKIEAVRRLLLDKYFTNKIVVITPPKA